MSLALPRVATLLLALPLCDLEISGHPATIRSVVEASNRPVRQIRVVVADDHTLILEAVKLALENADGVALVGTATSAAALLDLVRQASPDVALLDLRMPGMDGLTCLDSLRELYPRLKVVVLSAVDDERIVAESFRRGASAYVVKTVDPRDLAAAIRQAVEETVYTAPAGGAAPRVDSELDKLTAKEQAVLRALASGLSNHQIARELWLAEQTVKFHLTNVYRKLNVSNRTEAARFAYRHGLAAPRELDRG